MTYRVLGWHDDPDGGPRLRLDHERFAYAGKFVLPTGKAAALEPDAVLPDAREGYAEGVVAAAAFDEDRTDPDTLVVRYVTTRTDRRGEGYGTRLLAFVAARAHDRGYGTVRIAVNNPYSYEACAKAGFGYAGRETGLAELVMTHPGDRARYDDGLAVFVDRDLSDDERAFVDARRERGPPPVVSPPG